MRQTQNYIVQSTDGVPIHYEVHGTGEIALVFVHGWCCDRHYWDQQIEDFAPEYRVVLLDLAGHGVSGQDRIPLTIPTFGEDVVAVIEYLGLDQVVLIGHSMGGQTIVEAARRLPNVVIGLVGVDTWSGLARIRTPEQVTEIIEPFRTNFVTTTRAVVQAVFLPTSEPSLVERVVNAMSATPPHIGISAAEALFGNDLNLREGIKEITVPMLAINAENFGAANVQAAQHYGIEVVLVPGVGHFVMLEDPLTFNRLLHEAIRRFIQAKALQ